MRYYEILYIINPNFEKDKINSTIVEVTRKLEETKSKIINHYIWGKKRLSYPCLLYTSPSPRDRG